MTLLLPSLTVDSLVAFTSSRSVDGGYREFFSRPKVIDQLTAQFKLKGKYTHISDIIRCAALRHPSIESLKYHDPNAVFLDACVMGDTEVALTIMNQRKLSDDALVCGEKIAKKIKNYTLICSIVENVSLEVSYPFRLAFACECGDVSAIEEIKKVYKPTQEESKNCALLLLKNGLIEEAKSFYPDIHNVVIEKLDEQVYGDGKLIVNSLEVYDYISEHKDISDDAFIIAEDATMNGDLPLLKKLLDGMNDEDKGDAAMSCLDLAIQMGQEEIFFYLKDTILNKKRLDDIDTMISDQVCEGMSLSFDGKVFSPSTCDVNDYTPNARIFSFVRDVFSDMDGEDLDECEAPFHIYPSIICISCRKPDVLSELIECPSDAPIHLFICAIQIGGCTGMKCIDALLKFNVLDTDSLTCIKKEVGDINPFLISYLEGAVIQQ